MIRHLLAVAVALDAGAAAAQVWASNAGDDGSAFEAFSTAGQGVALGCGGPSPRGLSPEVTGNNHALHTPPGAIRVTFSTDLLGISTDIYGNPSFVAGMTIHGSNGAALTFPPLEWDGLWSEWSVLIGADQSLWEMMADSQFVDLSLSGRTVRVTTGGFGPAFASFVNSCATGFAAVGQQWPYPLPAAPPAPDMAALAAADAARQCGAVPILKPDAILTGEIDGDGRPDAVLFSGGIQCPGQRVNSLCGAANCSIDVFLSSLPPAANGGNSGGYNALDASLIPLSNGLMGIKMGSLQGVSWIVYFDGTAMARMP